jgi:cytoskeletal protein RodZ
MPTVGEQLRAAREQKKLSIEQLADQTKIRGDHLRALEASDFNVFSAPVYVKGFTRTYSNLLKLNTTELLAQLDRELSKSPAFEEKRIIGETPRSEPLWAILARVNWPVALASVLLLLIAVIAVTLVRSYRAEAKRDVVRELGPGLYEPKGPDPALYLAIPTNTPSSAPQRRP